MKDKDSQLIWEAYQFEPEIEIPGHDYDDEIYVDDVVEQIRKNRFALGVFIDYLKQII